MKSHQNQVSFMKKEHHFHIDRINEAGLDVIKSTWQQG